MAEQAQLRILTVCHRYPPDDAGGYPQLCFDVVQGLQQRGHQVLVLTTTPQTASATSEQPDVWRVLQPEVEFNSTTPPLIQQLTLARRLQHNEQLFLRAVAHHRPDIVFFWPSESMTKSLFELAENRLEVPVAYYVAGYSPLEPSALQRYWRSEARAGWKRGPKRVFRWGLERMGVISPEPPSLKPRHVACVSQHERQRVVDTGVPVSNTCVVYNGIDLVQFSFLGLPSSRRQPGGPLRLLYAGRLTQDKGVHVALGALSHLVHEHRVHAVSLTVLGKGDPQYAAQLHRMAAEHGLGPWLSFVEWMPRAEISAYMAGFDALVLPTIRAEPLARVVQEAMALGLVVIGTCTGGTPEVLLAEQTGLAVAPGDSRGLALQILRVWRDLELCDTLARSARQLVEERFDIERTVHQIETLLTRWSKKSAS